MNKSGKIVAVIGQGILQAGIRQLIRVIVPSSEVSFLEGLQDCLSGKSCPGYIIIESSLLPEPAAYSLERILSKNRHTKILLIENNFIDDAVKTFSNEIIFKRDPEQIVLKKLNVFFDTPENETKKEYDDTLSEREREIVELVALGKTNKEISDQLFISPHTVITHRKNITSKLGIKTIAGLTVYAVLNNIISPEDI